MQLRQAARQTALLQGLNHKGQKGHEDDVGRNMRLRGSDGQRDRLRHAVTSLTLVKAYVTCLVQLVYEVMLLFASPQVKAEAENVNPGEHDQ
jgi:hypothetical protein